ncbi:MAG: calcium-binding protein, partial [Betaproteobacteria bacterium]|nr:calcium-binding protein [Betaproteobacteria bacterium]
MTGIDDAVADGDVLYNIITAAAVSTDGSYSGFDAANVSVTNTDNDTAGITVSPTTGLITTEAGGSDTFTVVLTSQPTADVTIALSSSDLTEGTVGAASLTFTAANWNVAQTVTVTGVDDAIADGDVLYNIITAAAVSSDGNYSGLDPADVSVTNTDNDTAGITVSPTTGLTTTEAGGSDTFTVVLTSQPTADVVVGLSSSDTTEGTVGPASLTFTAANWNVAQTVTVTGVDDAIADGDIGYTILTAAAVSSDTTYNGINPDDVSVTNTDNDTAGITVTPTTGLITTETGGTATFTVVLTSQPT